MEERKGYLMTVEGQEEVHGIRMEYLDGGIQQSNSKEFRRRDKGKDTIFHSDFLAQAQSEGLLFCFVIAFFQLKVPKFQLFISTSRHDGFFIRQQGDGPDL